MPLEYAEMQNFPLGKWDLGEFDGRRRLKVAWDDVSDLLLALEHESWPYSDGPNNAYPYQALIKPFPNCEQKGSGSLASYDWALVDAYYTTRGPQWNQSLGYSIKETSTPYSRLGRIDPTGRLYWTNAKTFPVSPTDAPSTEWHGSTYTISYSGLTNPPNSAWDYSRFVNSNTVVSHSLGKTFAPETLLYKGMSMSATFTWGKLPRYGASYNFLHWPVGHNKFFKPGEGFVDMYYWDGSTFAIYKQYESTFFNI